MKISNVKRSHHLKNKKNYAKPLKKKQLATATKTTDKNAQSTSKKIFGRPSVEKPKTRNKKKFVKNQMPMPKIGNGTPANGHADAEADENEEENEYEDMLDMMDEEDKAAIEGLRKSQKRKRDENDNDSTRARVFEKQHAHEARMEASKKTRTVDLLPIKTKAGDLITRTTEVEIDDVQPDEELGSEEEDDDDGEAIDSDDDIVNDRSVSNFSDRFLIVWR